jgi:hypothetical protein
MEQQFAYYGTKFATDAIKIQYEADIRALGRGEWIQRQNGDTSLAVWKDQKVVWLLYNHCSPAETASLERWSKAGNKVSIGCPKAIRDYFYNARSVDVLSQLHYAYALERPCGHGLA